MLGIVYVLLFLVGIIALMGIASTLSLEIHERTRELGVLRAIGHPPPAPVPGPVGVGDRRPPRHRRWSGLGVSLGWALVQAASAARHLPRRRSASWRCLVAGALAGFSPAAGWPS